MLVLLQPYKEKTRMINSIIMKVGKVALWYDVKQNSWYIEMHDKIDKTDMNKTLFVYVRLRKICLSK